MYLICGYPPFLKQLVDSDEIDLSGYDVVAAVGGEGLSESLGSYMLRSFMAVYSSFGAADLEINIAAENDFTMLSAACSATAPRSARHSGCRDTRCRWCSSTTHSTTTSK